jgi:hypothetical protein
MKTSILTCALSAAALLALSPTAQAQYVFFPNDTTIDYTVTQDIAILGYANENDYTNRVNGTSPTVALVTGGFVNVVNAYNSSLFNMSGGDAGLQVQSFDSSTLNISGGHVSDVVTGDDISTVNMSGGRAGLLQAAGSSTVNMSGGSTDNPLFALDSGIINFSGGSAPGLQATESSVINYRGGATTGTHLFAEDDSTLNLYGMSLSSVLVDPNAFGYTEYSLSGTLLDGTSVDGKFIRIEHNSNAQFLLHNVPAPGALLTALLGAFPGAVVLLLRRRK